MKKYLFAKLISLVLIASVVFVPLLPPTPAYADCQGGSSALNLLPPWYKGLQCKKDQSGNDVISPPKDQGGLQAMIIKIVLNVIEALLYIVGYISLGMIIWGGFKYMFFGDNPGGVEGAKKTIMNAIIGLVISIFAVVIVNLIAGAF